MRARSAEPGCRNQHPAYRIGMGPVMGSASQFRPMHMDATVIFYARRTRGLVELTMTRPFRPRGAKWPDMGHRVRSRQVRVITRDVARSRSPCVHADH